MDTRYDKCHHLEREQESRKLYNGTGTVVPMDNLMTGPKGSLLLADLSQEHKVVTILWRKNKPLCIPPIGASVYELLTSMLCEEGTPLNEVAIRGLSWIN